MGEMVFEMTQQARFSQLRLAGIPANIADMLAHAETDLSIPYTMFQYTGDDHDNWLNNKDLCQRHLWVTEPSKPTSHWYCGFSDLTNMKIRLNEIMDHCIEKVST